MTFSPVVPLIALILVGWFAAAARRVDAARNYRVATGVAVACMAAWIALCGWLGSTEFFARENASFLPVVVFALLPIPAWLVGLAASAPLRGVVRQLVRRLPRRWSIAIHAVRIAAVGTVWGMFSGAVPVYFALAAGVPDLLIGLSAPYVARRVDRISDAALIAWNAAGITVFVVALIAMQLALPGPLRVFDDEPTARRLVLFPTVLVPTFVAPSLILIHLVSMAQVVRRGTPAFG